MNTTASTASHFIVRNKVIKAVEAVTGLKKKDFFGKSRKFELLRARMLTILSMYYFGISSERTAWALDKTKAYVNRVLKSALDQKDTDLQFKQDYESIIKASE